MEAHVTEPGTFVLQVAGIGNELLASFTKFLTSRKVQERRMDNVLATISITTSYLTDLGTQLNRYAHAVRIEDSVTRPTCEVCKKDFEKLLAITKEGSGSGLWMREGTLGGALVTAEVDPWFLFNMALGGRDNGEEFWTRIEATRTYVSTLTDTVKYKILKELKKQDCLTPELAEELKNLTASLPQLVKSIERGEKYVKELKELEAKKNELLERERVKEDEVKAIKTNGNKPDDGEKDGFAKPVIERKASYAPSEAITAEPALNKSRAPIIIEDDRRSIDSWNSMDDSNFHDTKEIFEEWQLRWNVPKNEPRTTWSLFGIKIKEFYNAAGFWGIDPELRSNVELQEQYEKFTADVSPAKHRATVDKAMRSLPLEARETVEGLIEDRERLCNNGKFRRQWSIIAVRPRTKHHYGGEGLLKSAKSKDWLIMLKGETVDRIDRQLPTRWMDPWRKPYPRRPVDPVRSRGRGYYNDRNARNWSPERRERVYSPVPLRRAARSRSPVEIRVERRHRHLTRDSELDGFQPGTIVVGAVPNAGEAEKKMDEILEDLPAKFAI